MIQTLLLCKKSILMGDLETKPAYSHKQQVFAACENNTHSMCVFNRFKKDRVMFSSDWNLKTDLYNHYLRQSPVYVFSWE